MNAGAPHSNIRAPENLQSSNSKEWRELSWILGLGISLDVGAWDLEL